MALNGLAQRFEVSRGLLNEPDLQRIRNASKMNNANEDAWIAFKIAKLTGTLDKQCLK